MSRDTILINKAIIPCDFNIVLGNEVFNMRVDYNNIGEFFTVELTKDEETLCAGEPIVYGKPLFSDVRNSKFPAVDIVPYDPSGGYNKVTYSNLCEGVLLVIDDQETSVLEG